MQSRGSGPDSTGTGRRTRLRTSQSQPAGSTLVELRLEKGRGNVERNTVCEACLFDILCTVSIILNVGMQ